MNNNTGFAPTVADRIANWFKIAGLQKVFMYPGGTIAPLVNGFLRAGIKIEVFKHEQGAAYAALAHARLTGVPQVVMVTSGPGVTNVITPLADAFYDSTPLFVITGQIGTADLTSGRRVRQRGFQEVPTVEIVKAICKEVRCPLNVEDAMVAVAELFEISRTERQGPVVLDLAGDIQRSNCPEVINEKPFQSMMPHPIPDDKVFTEIADALNKAQKPIILLGQGALRSAAFDEFKQLAEQTGSVIVTSLLGVGSYDTSDHRYLGFIGHTGHAAANAMLHQADFLLAVGARLDVRQTGTVTDAFVPDGKIAWILNDPDELNYPRIQTDWSVLVDARLAVTKILAALPNKNREVIHSDWLTKCLAEVNKKEDDKPINSTNIQPRNVFELITPLMKKAKHGIVTTGVGSHQQWAARHLPFGPNGWQLLTSGGHGAMGYDLPTAIGAAMAKPSHSILCVVGDGSLMMNIQELASLIERNLPIKILVINNGRLAIVSQFQKITWGQDPTTGAFVAPNFETIARAFGLYAITAKEPSELESAILEFWNTGGPVLLDVHIDSQAEVVPMLLAGQTMNALWHGYHK